MKLIAPAAIVLDTTPLNLLTRRINYSKGSTCWDWYKELAAFGCRFYVPEIADFEARREYIRSGQTDAITRLEALNAAEPDRYLPLKTGDVRLAAELWASSRNKNNPYGQNKGGAPKDALDGDTLIAAQAILLPLPPGLTHMVVATENVSHLGHLVTADLWSDIRP